MKTRTFFAVAAAASMLAGSSRGADRVASVLVVPARLRVVKLAFDVASMARADIVSYQTTSNSPAPFLHFWSGTQWTPIAMQQYAGGLFDDRAPRRVVLIGGDRELPASLVEASEWAAEVIRVQSLDIANIVGSLDALYRFTPAEWMTLAERHGLRLADVNEERRQSGRFGPQGSELPKPARRTPGIILSGDLDSGALAPGEPAEAVPVPARPVYQPGPYLPLTIPSEEPPPALVVPAPLELREK